MSTAQEATIGERIESAPKTVLFFGFGISVLAVGFLLEVGLGMSRSAGLAGAFAVIIIGVAALIHLLYWFLGQLD